MAVLTNTMMQGTSAISDDAATAYRIEKSLRFGGTKYLSKSFGEGNRYKWTWSGWLKRSTFPQYNYFFTARANGTRYFNLGFTDDALKWYHRPTSGTHLTCTTTTVFRDPSAWYHIVMAWDTTQATDSERVKLYVNGERITSFSSTTWPPQWTASICNDNIHHELGAYDSGQSYPHEGYIADPYFIDGLALHAAAFGEFDSNTGVWNPKALTPPAPNDGTTWSSSLTSTGAFDTAATLAFNGLTSDGAKPDDNCTATFQPSSAISCVSSIRIHFSIAGSGVAPDDVTINDLNKGDEISAGWNTFTDIRSLEKITWKHRSGVIGFTVDAIEVDGVTLVDGIKDPTSITNPNNGTHWSESRTGDNNWENADTTPARVFDGNMDGSAGNPIEAAAGGNNFTFTFGGGISNVETLDIDLKVTGSVGTDTDCKVNGTSIFNAAKTAVGDNVKGWYQVPSATHGGNLNSLYGGRDSGGNVKFYGIKVNGVELIDQKTDNSFHLKLNDATSDLALGKDSIQGKIANADAGLPIYNTTDELGYTKGIGNRTDSLSGNLKLAIPGDSVSSTAMDVSSADHDVTVDGVTLSTDYSRFYGSSLKFVSTETDSLKITGESDFAFGTGDFCVEFWIYNTNNKNYNAFIATRSGGSTEDGWVIASNASGYLYIWSNGMMAGSGSGEHLLPLNEWCHVAYTRASGTHRLFLNGIPAGTASTTSRDYTNDDITIGTNPFGSEDVDGYMQDIRVYKGAAKYTSHFTPPNFFDFAVNNINATDQSRSIADATKALPIYNTTGAQGETKGSGYRNDPHKANLVLAIPGDVLTDVSNHADLRNSGSAKATDANGSTVVSTNNSRFYGSSIFFDGNADYLEVGNSADYDFDGDFTVEAWIFVRAYTNDYAGVFGFSHDSDQHGWNILMRSDGTPHINVDMNYTDVANANIPLHKWTHIALVRSGTSSANVKFYTNGAQGSTTLSENDSTGTPSTTECMIGSYPGYETTREFNGFIQDIRIYKGVAKYTTAFDPEIPDLGVPEDLDSMTDSPSNYIPTDEAGNELADNGGVVRGNYCTFNTTSSTEALAAGALEAPMTDHPADFGRGTFPMTTGKWYFEWTKIDLTGQPFCGLTDKAFNEVGDDVGGFHGNGYIYPGGNGPHGALEIGNVIGIGLDADNGSIALYKNGALKHTITGITSESGYYLPYFGGTNGGSSKVAVNFGQRPFKYQNAGTDRPAADYKSVCSTNIPDTFSGTALNNPSKYFDINTWVGNGGTNNIKGLEFQPDLVWYKRRNATGEHCVFDAVRGVHKGIHPDLSDAEWDVNTTLTAFNSDGFTLGSHGLGNTDGGTFVGWNWDAGTAATGANNNGTINIASGDQWVNATAGFSITKYTSNNTSGATVGHGLNVPPQFIIIKNTEDTNNWHVYHKDMGNTHGMYLDLTNDSDDDASLWNDTSPTNTVFSLGNGGGTNNSSSHEYIAYCWAPIAGYSAFGYYDANNSADGPSIVLPFKPRWLMIKRTNGNNNWIMKDTKRYSRNPQESTFLADGNHAETDFDIKIDFLANGFKIRSTDNNTNTSGSHHIYAAFAENPFKLARAR